jgi:hypothetical protein
MKNGWLCVRLEPCSAFVKVEGSFPLDGARRLRGVVVDHAVDALDLVDAVATRLRKLASNG